MTGEGIRVSELTFNASDMYNISIQTLSNGGDTIDNLTWNDWTEYPAGSGEWPAFWENNFSGEPYDLVVKPGDGLWIQGADGDSVQSAGEVGKEDIIVTWTEGGFKLIANTFPVPLKVDDLVFTASDMYNISIQTLTNGGDTIDNLTWNDWTEYPAGSGEWPSFWENNFSGEPCELIVQPGEALWIQAAAGDSVRIPAPELN